MDIFRLHIGLLLIIFSTCFYSGPWAKVGVQIQQAPLQI